MNKGIKRKLEQKPDHILLKESVEPIKLTSKDILSAIDRNNSEVDKMKNQLLTMDQQKIQLNKNIEYLEEALKDFKKHEEWAEKIQLSKMKSLVEEVKEEVKKKVEDKYEHDDGLSKEQNNIQKFAQYRELIARHQKIGENIAGRIINKNLRTKGYLKNPFV